MANIHLILQGKGGVGKSVSAWVLAQYLQDRAALEHYLQQNKSSKGSQDDLMSMQDLSYLEMPEAPLNHPRNPVLIDIDPLNPTLSDFKALKVHRFNLFEDTGDPYQRFRLKQVVFDDMMDLILKTPNDIVIDVGSAGYAPFCAYLIDNEIFKLLYSKTAAYKHRVIIHTVIVGGDNFATTMSSFMDLAAQLPVEQNPQDASSPSIDFVVWLNPYFGATSVGGKGFEDSAAYSKYQNRILGLIRMPDTRHKELFDLAMSKCLELRWTFRQFVEAGKPAENGVRLVSLMSVSRIVHIRDDYYAELDAMIEI